MRVWIPAFAGMTGEGRVVPIETPGRRPYPSRRPMPIVARAASDSLDTTG